MPRNARTGVASKPSSRISRVKLCHSMPSPSVGAGEFAALFVASDAPEVWLDEAKAEELRRGLKFLVVQDTTVTPLANWPTW